MQKLEFHGKGDEYFKIWIVNLALTICTFGIYSAWAKVRTRRYILGNTLLGSSAFDYHADPKKILIGRIIVAGLFFIYYIAGKISPLVAMIVFSLLVLGVFPWVYVRSRMFNFSNTSFKGLRFGFDRAYQEAYINTAKSIFINFITLGFGFPYALYLHFNFSLKHTRYGQTHFIPNFDARSVFNHVYSAVGFYIVGAIIIGFAAIIKSPVMVLGGFVATYVLAGYAYAYIRANILNLLVRRTTLGEFKLDAQFLPSEYFKMIVVNTLLTVLTFGLGFPWARMRMLRYVCSQISVNMTPEQMNVFSAGEALKVGATADAAFDFWDVDFGI